MIICYNFGTHFVTTDATLTAEEAVGLINSWEVTIEQAELIEDGANLVVTEEILLINDEPSE